MQLSSSLDYDPSRPIIHCDASLNQISSEMARIEREVYRLRGIIGAFDETMQENAALTTDIMDAYLKELMSPLDQREISVIRQQIDTRIGSIKENCLENYRGLLDARELIVIEGQTIQLNAQTKVTLEHAYQQRLEENIYQLKEEFSLGEATDLEQMQAQLKEKFERYQDIFEKLFECKQQLTDQGYELQEAMEPELAKLRAKKQELQKDLKVTDLFIASQLGAIDYLKQEISKKWRWGRKDFVNTPSQVGFAPLHYAAYHNQREAMQLLIDKGADLTLKDSEGYLPLHWAAEKGHDEIVQLLIHHKPSTINAKGRLNRTPLHRAVFCGKVETTHLLLKNGAHINAQTNEKNHCQTPLHFAVLQGNISMVLALTRYPELDILQQDSQGQAPLHYAIEEGLIDILNILLKHPSWQKATVSTHAKLLESLLSIVPKRQAKEIKAQLLLNFPK
ncbi:ankyrin repeat domain-containing protein [Neochlamydia sp. S13]|uniref:ankyrin repeat domain-containing protein n=1 Tax=Neochlamydia sp. S13 TaxID=1353976 RepID=UPI0005AB89DF|nr:ankyrin repeat domain-containing protein [Neochlamydia sp. S13]BBI16702.1 Putative uncharacterized protein [Neochlamydia sp. S13]